MVNVATCATSSASVHLYQGSARPVSA